MIEPGISRALFFGFARSCMFEGCSALAVGIGESFRESATIHLKRHPSMLWFSVQMAVVSRTAHLNTTRAGSKNASLACQAALIHPMGAFPSKKVTFPETSKQIKSGYPLTLQSSPGVRNRKSRTLEEIPQRIQTARVAQLTQRGALNLADAFARQVKPLADFLEGMVDPIHQPKTQL